MSQSYVIAVVRNHTVYSHGDGILHGQVSETTPSTGDGDIVADIDIGVLECLVGGDTGAQERGSTRRVQGLGDGSDVVDEGADVLREGTVGGIAGKLGLSAV